MNKLLTPNFRLLRAKFVGHGRGGVVAGRGLGGEG